MRRLLSLVVACLLVAAWASAQAEVDATKLYLWEGGSSRGVLSTGSGAPSAGATSDWYVDYSTGDIWTKRLGTWTVIPRLEAINNWTAAQALVSTEPTLHFHESDQGSNLKRIRLDLQGGVFSVQTLDDAGSSVLATILSLTRAGALTVASGITAGSGGVGIVDATGKIPAISSVYFASLSGANLTSIPTTALTGALQAAQFPALTGDVTTVAGALATTLATVNANVGTFGSSTAIGTFTVNAKGLITAASSITPQLTLTSTYFSSLSGVNLTGVDLLGSVNTHTLAGLHTWTGGTNGNQRLVTVNTTSGTAAMAGYRADAGTTILVLDAFSQGFTTSGAAIASSVKLEGTGVGGVTLIASSASGDARIYSRNALAATFGASQALDLTGATTFATTAGSSGYASLTTGWQATNAGAGDFRNLVTDELRAKVFTADLESVTRGSSLITKSYGILSSAFTCPVAAGTATVTVKDAPEAPNVRLFATNDWVVLRTWSRTDADTDGNLDLTISDCVGQVSAYSDGTNVQSWTFTRGGSGASAGSMPSTTVVPINNIAIDYGPAGSGFIESSATDGAEAVNAPYVQAATFVTAPLAANVTARVRVGNVKGQTGTAEYGLVAGAYGSSNGAFFRATDTNFDLHGITQKWWDTTTNVITIAPNSGSPYIGIGNPAPSACCATAGLFLGWDHATLKAKVSFYADANNFFTYDGTNVSWKGANASLSTGGNLTATGGAIGGWTLSSTTLTATNITLTSGAANTANILVGTGATAGGLNSANAASDIAIWAGSTFANRATAPFRVRADGAATMTSVTINAGNVTLDTTGLFISPVSAGGGGAYANANAVRWTTDTTYRTAIWRSDDSAAAAFRKWWFENISNGTVHLDTRTSLVTKNLMSTGTGSGSGQLHTRGQVSNVGDALLYSYSDDGSGSTRAAVLYLGAKEGSPGLRDIALGFSTAEPVLSGTGLSVPTLTQGLYINISGTQLYDATLRVGTDSHTLTQANAVVAGSSNAEAFGVSGGTQSGVNVNFYADAATNGQRRATIQAQRACTSNRGGQLLLYSKPDTAAGTDVALAGYIDCNQGLVWGTPTGGSKGAGTGNFQAVYDDNVLLTDWVYELYYDGQAKPSGGGGRAETRPHTKRLYSIEEVRTVTETEHRLPWMPSADTFETERGIGRMLTSIWQGHEQQMIYQLEAAARIAAQEARLVALEAEVARLRAGGQP